MHILVPDELYESLREKAFHAKTSMSKVVVMKLQEGVPGVTKTPTPKFIKDKPLVPSPGIIKDVKPVGTPPEPDDYL